MYNFTRFPWMSPLISYSYIPVSVFDSEYRIVAQEILFLLKEKKKTEKMSAS